MAINNRCLRYVVALVIPDCWVIRWFIYYLSTLIFILKFYVNNLWLQATAMLQLAVHWGQMSPAAPLCGVVTGLRLLLGYRTYYAIHGRYMYVRTRPNWKYCTKGQEVVHGFVLPESSVRRHHQVLWASYSSASISVHSALVMVVGLTEEEEL